MAWGRASGGWCAESAALLFTAGFAHALNGFFPGLSSPGATLTVAVYAKDRGEFEAAFAIAAILMVLVNLCAALAGRYF